MQDQGAAERRTKRVLLGEDRRREKPAAVYVASASGYHH
jgi:hypothetical protein